MKTISVGQLRQNPTPAFDAVERGETFLVTRHRREIGRLVPSPARTPVTAEDYLAVLRRAPLDAEWATELAETRGDFDAERDPWDVA